MSEQQKVTYSQLDVGYEFPPVSFRLEPSSVSAYLKATGESNLAYEETGKVPPTAIAAWSLASLLEYIELPDGTIHLTQEIQSLDGVTEGIDVTCSAKVSRKQERGKLKLLNIDIEVVDQNHQPVLSGKAVSIYLSRATQSIK